MKNIRSDKLRTNAILNVIRQLFSIIFPLITFPYISRTLGAECYGKVNYTASIISYISLIAGLGITNYAVREGSRLKDEPVKLEHFIKEIFTLNCLALTVAYVFLAFVVFYYKENHSYQILLLITSVSVFFTVLGCEWLNVIYEDYLFITVRYIFFQAISVLLTVVFVKSPEDLFLYALISQFGSVLANISNVIHFYKRWKIKIGIIFDSQIFSHLKYVLILFGNSVSMLIYVNSDITLLGIFCGDLEVGLYSVAVKIYSIVKQLLNAMLIVGVPQMSRWKGKKQNTEISRQLDSLLSTLLIFLIPCIVGLFCLSDLAVALMAGEGYAASGSALKVLSLTLVFSTGVCFYSNLVLIPNNMEKYILWATSISAILNIVLNSICIPYFGMIAAACTTMLSESFSVIFMLIVSRKVFFPSVGKTCLQSIVSGIIIYACCMLTLSLKMGLIQTIIYSITISGVLWVLYWFAISRFSKRHTV